MLLGQAARGLTKVLGLSVIVDYGGRTQRPEIGGRHESGTQEKSSIAARERLWHASLRAEDDAVAYLHEFDPAVAFATACSVEQHWRSNGRRNKRK